MSRDLILPDFLSFWRLPCRSAFQAEFARLPRQSQCLEPWSSIVLLVAGRPWGLGSTAISSVFTPHSSSASPLGFGALLDQVFVPLSPVERFYVGVLTSVRIGISNHQSEPSLPISMRYLVARNQPYVASKLRSRVAGLENLAASRLRRRALGRCRATQPARRAARMAPTPACAAA